MKFLDPVITNINHNQSNLPKEKPTIVVSNVLCDEKISSKENSGCKYCKYLFYSNNCNICFFKSLNKYFISYH